LNLDRHAILVVGGGAVAERKVRTLLGCGARVRLVSPDATHTLGALASEGEIIWEMRSAEKPDFESHAFAVITTPKETSDEVISMARDAGCALDVCSDGACGDFALCAQFESDGAFVGVSSGGNSPARAASVKRMIMDRMPRKSVVVLTRNSPLAMAQTEMWIEALRRAGVGAVIRTVSSHGDRDRTSDLSAFGFGAFVKALEDELLEGRGGMAVHSMKDMPAVLPEETEIAVLERGPVSDVLVARNGRKFGALPSGARVGTSSVRRRAQVKAARPDLECVSCRGNVGTRLEKLERGEIDALILAEAGLERLKLNGVPFERLPFVTAACQGAVAAETRAGSPLAGTLRSLNHLPTWYEVTAERAFLSRIGLGCVCPMGVNARIESGFLELRAEVYPMEPCSGEPERASVRGAAGSERDALALAEELWDMMRGKPLIRAMTAARGGDGK
jgi:hydroxymethylbilane synthase